MRHLPRRCTVNTRQEPADDKLDLSPGPVCERIPHVVGKLTGRKKGAMDESADAAATS